MTAAAETPVNVVADPRRWQALALVCAAFFMTILDVSIVNVALPSIQKALNFSRENLQWVVTAYAIMFATSLALLAQAFQGKERGLAFGIWGSITGVAVAVGPVLGGLLTTGLSWKWIFFVNVPVGVFAFIVTVWKVEESRQASARRPDWAGFVLFTASLSSLVYGLIRSNEKGWTETVVLGCFVAAVVLMVAFLVVETVSSNAMFDLHLFKKPTFVGAAIAAFCLSASAFALLLYLVLYLQDAKQYSALATGLRLLVYSGAIMVAATIAGRLSSKAPVKLLIAPGLLLVGGGLLWMTVLSPSSDWTALVPGFIVAGIGTGMVNPPLASAAIGVVAPQQAGMASGISSTFRQVGIATGTAAMGSIFASRLASDLRTSLARVPGIGSHTSSIANLIRNGDGSQAVASAPARYRGAVAGASLSSFVNALDELLLIGAVIALTGGVLCFFLIRAKDFVPHGAPAQGGPDRAQEQGAGDGAAEDGSATSRVLIASGAGHAGTGGGNGDGPGRDGDGLPGDHDALARGDRDGVLIGAEVAGHRIDSATAGNGHLGSGSGPFEASNGHAGPGDDLHADGSGSNGTGRDGTGTGRSVLDGPAWGATPTAPPAAVQATAVPAVPAGPPAGPSQAEVVGGDRTPTDGEDGNRVTREVSVSLTFKLRGPRRDRR